MEPLTGASSSSFKQLYSTTTPDDDDEDDDDNIWFGDNYDGVYGYDNDNAEDGDAFNRCNVHHQRSSNSCAAAP